MPGETEELFNPGVLQDEGDGLFLEFDGDEGADAGAGGAQGGGAGAGAEAGAEGGAGGEGSEAGAQGGGNPSFVPVDQFNKVLTELAELRGRVAARDEHRPEPSQPAQPDLAAQTQQQQAEQFLKRRVKEISAKLYDPETAESAVEELLGLTGQISALQANAIVQQRLGSTQTTASDLIIENFLAKKEKKDELYDEIEPLFEAELSKYDRSQLSGRSRQELTAALDYLYKGVRADVLDKKFRDAKERALQRRSAAPKMGGGRGADVGGGRLAPKGGKITDSMREYVRKAGFAEDQIDAILGSAFGTGEEE